MKFENMYAERIGGKSFGVTTTLFKFEKIKQDKRKAMREHPDEVLIDLGIGEPDEMADIGIVDSLYKEAKKWENRTYADNGIIEFQRAAAGYLENVYGVRNINPQTQLLHTIGSKAALSIIPQAFINPGDITLMTVPGYPILGTKTKWCGGEVYDLPLIKENSFLPQLDKIPEEILRRAKLMYINYPNNPTGTVATKKFYEQVVQFAKKNDIIVIQDAAYAALTFGARKPLSFLSVEGAMDVGIEIHSLSKAFNMTGWRLGFIVGNEKIVKAVAAAKDNNDSGQFRAIQKAGIYALNHPELTRKTCEKYERRHKKLCSVFREAGFDVQVPETTFYEYVAIPKRTFDGTIFHTASEFSEYLLLHSLISTVPWEEAGQYIRVSVTFVADTIEKEDEIIELLRKRLNACKFRFS